MDFGRLRVNELKLVVAGTNDEALAEAICIHRAREALGDEAKDMTDTQLLIEALERWVAEVEAGVRQFH